MQRSTNRLATRLAARMTLTYVLLCAPALGAAQGTSPQPITVTVEALQAGDSFPGASVFNPVFTPLRAGDQFFYLFDIQPKNDPQTPITLQATFDPRLDVFTIGGDGNCVGLYDNVYTLTCRDQYIGTSYPHMTNLWVWFNVKPSNNPAPIIMTVTTPNDSKTITLTYASTIGKVYLPLIKYKS
jgi:hypothetical protein